MSGLPPGWAIAQLSTLGDLRLGKMLDRAKNQGLSTQYLRNINVRWFGFDLSDLQSILVSPDEQEQLSIHDGDVLICEGGEPGRCAVWRGGKNVLVFQKAIHRFRPSGAILPELVMYRLRNDAASGTLAEAFTGTTIKHLTGQSLARYSVPVPPLREQKRIVNKLDTLLAQVDACRERLDRVPGILKRFRQSVLAAATSGRLTEDWRDENPAKVSAAVEVEVAERKRLGLLRVRADKELEAIELFELPESWAWVKNARLAKDTSNAICAGPFGTIFKAKDFREAGVPIIFLRHVTAGKYLVKKPGFMDPKVWSENHRPYSVKGGELLVTKLGDPPGTACIYPRGIGVAMVTPDVMKMEVDDQVASAIYLMHYFNSYWCQNIVKQLAFGVTRLRIDLTMFKGFPIALPPLEEQQEIVRRVEILFAYADELEARVAVARAQVERLTPALLAKAFRGELVPQDPNDESAEVLLERLRAENAGQEKKRRGRKA